MNRRSFLQGGAAALTSGAGKPDASGHAASRRPNLLFILADQWRAQTLGCAGDRDLRAPNLDRLAREGVHFTRTYSVYPLCTPARASMLTGRYPHSCRMPTNNLLLPLEERCIAEQLKKAGYATGYIGKWHLDGEPRPGFVPPGPRRRGFDYWAAFNRGHFYFNSTYYLDTPEPIRPDGFEPDYQTGLAIDFMRKNRDRPFYLFLSWGPPHTPRTPPPRHAKTYDPRQFRLRPNVPEHYEAQAREGHAGYYGLCTSLDDNVGRLLKAVEELGLRDDTIVVFTSDHGDMVGSHGLEHKNLPFEESAAIPFLMRYPRRLQAGKNDALISNLDFVPTFLSLCGAAVPNDVQGRDLADFILNGKGERPESIYCEGAMRGDKEWRMVIRGADKLVVDTSMEVTHLFNLTQDPYEQRNLAAEPEQRTKRDELVALVRHWAMRTADRFKMPER